MKIFTTPLQYFLLLAILIFSKPLFSQDKGKKHKEGEMLVQLQPGESLKDFLKQHPGLKLIAPVAENWNIYLVGFDKLKRSESSVLNELGRNKKVAGFQRNHKVELRNIPNDPQFGDMWGLHNTGQNGATVDADIDAPEAWEITTGGVTAHGDTIVVAVIDDGFQLDHPDLDFWVNRLEIPGNGIDDDGNGFVDDVIGWNAYNQDGNISAQNHGTHVSGTIGAKGNNGLGVTGVNWNVKVMAVQGSSGDESTVISAYNYVFTQRKLYDQTNGQKGAFVVATNASFGVDFGQPANFPLWCAIYDSLGSLGILNAGATANSNLNIDATGDMPTACPSDWLVSVTNTTKYETKNSGAAYGLKTIDLGAPGTQILSTTTGSNYSSLTGTSMATPHVSGTIALMWAAACPEILDEYKLNPAATAKKMKEALLAGTDPIAALQGITVSGGRLNAHKALLAVDDYCTSLSAPIVKGDTVCENEAFQLVADPNGPGREVHWFLDPNLGAIHIGDTLNVPGIIQNELYFAANMDLTTNILSPKVSAPVVISIPIQAVSNDTSIVLHGGEAHIWVKGGNTYLWQPSTGLNNHTQSNPVAKPVQTTTYVVTVSDKFGCVAQDSVTVAIIDNTSIPEYPPFNNYKVYPVPSRESVVFEFDKDIKEKHNIRIRIVDLLGKALRDEKISGDRFVLERMDMPSGLYWYIIEGPDLQEQPSGKIILID